MASNNNNQYHTPPSGVSQAATMSNSTMMAMMRNTGAAGGAVGSSSSGQAVTINASTGGIGVGGGGPGHFHNQLQARMGQILDDADHKRCSEGNQRALLAEKLENLRQLTKELEKDEWMYVKKKKMNKGGFRYH